MGSVMIQKHGDRARADQGAGEPVERGCREAPLRVICQEAVFDQEIGVVARRDGADVLQLLGVANNHRPLRPVEKWEGRSDIALAGLINDDEIEEGRVQWDSSAGGEGGDRPAIQNLGNLWESSIVLRKYLGPRAALLLVRLNDQLDEREEISQI